MNAGLEAPEVMLEHLRAGALRNLRENGYLAPILFMMRADGEMTAMPLSANDSDLRHRQVNLIRQAGAIMPELSRVMVVMEAWVADYGAGQDKKVRPADREDRREVVMMSLQDRGQASVMQVYEIIRDKEGAPIDLRLDPSFEGVDALGGPMANILPVDKDDEEGAA